MHIHQKLTEKWSDHIGNMFSVSNGVKQGSVLFPTLFSIYLDGLLTKFNKRCVDYLTLIAPSRKTLHFRSVCLVIVVIAFVIYRSLKQNKCTNIGVNI